MASPTSSPSSDSAAEKTNICLTTLGRPSFICRTCGSDLALQDELVSKSFSGRDGPAFLLRSTVNVTQGKEENKVLLTGLHTIADISCNGCGARLGWTYLKAYHSSQRYKEGKFIIEKDKLAKDNQWQ